MIYFLLALMIGDRQYNFLYTTQQACLDDPVAIASTYGEDRVVFFDISCPAVTLDADGKPRLFKAEGGSA